MQNNAFRLGHRPELDGLRGIAVFLVMLHHAGIALFGGSHIGVDIFFVLSGFLITALLWREYEQYGRISLKNFYARRFLRLTPALVLLLAVFGGYAVATKSGAELAKSGKAIIFTALYLSDFALAFGFAPLGAFEHTWSLAIEEHFYLLYPVALALLLRSKLSRQNIFKLLALLTILIAIHRVFLWSPDAHSIARVYYGFDARADGLLIGCLLGLAVVWGKLPQVKRFGALLAALVLLFAAIFAVWDSPLYAYGLSAINLSTAVVLTFILAERPRYLTNKVLVWIGTISYGLYLWHYPVFILTRERITESPLGILVLGGAASVGCAALSYYLVEKPCLKLKKRFAAPALQAEKDDAAVFNSPAPQSVNS